MKRSNINYPHPVLSSLNEDYLDCSFNITLPKQPRIEGDYAFIEVSYNLRSSGLTQMIQDGTAKVMVCFESVHSEYRKAMSFLPDKESQEFSINKNDLSKLVKISGYIVLNRIVERFSLPEHNASLFGSIPFLNLRAGDILAIADDSFEIPLESYDPLADRPSIFSIRRQTDTKDEVQVDFLSGNKILIYLNDEMFNKYKHLYDAPELRSIIASLFAVPVLVDVLSYLRGAGQDEIEEVFEKKWYQVIDSRLKELQVKLDDENSMTKVANMVLPHVFHSFLDSSRNVFESMLPDGGDLK